MKLALYFLGLGYHCDKPLLYYARKLACQHGYAEYQNLEYQITVKNIKDNSEKMQEAFHQAFVQSEEMLNKIDFKKYDEILFVSKSIGTAVATAYQEKYADTFQGKKVKNVYFTPLEMTFDFSPQKGIAFSGTKDPWITIDAIKEKSQQTDVELHIIENVNHSLEEENVFRNVTVLNIVMNEVEKYLQADG